jgi:hypothetical protein
MVNLFGDVPPTNEQAPRDSISIGGLSPQAYSPMRDLDVLVRAPVRSVLD